MAVVGAAGTDRRWSLTRSPQRLLKSGGRLLKQARYYWLRLAEGHLTRLLFGDMLRRIALLLSPAGQAEV